MKVFTRTDIGKTRNMNQDSFYISEELLLRTHTSPMQARTMEKSGLVHIYTHGKMHIPYGNESTEIVKDYISYAHSNLEKELRTYCN